MIEYKIDNSRVEVKMEGTPLTITTECLELITAIYRGFESPDGSNDLRELFRGNLVNFLTDPDSPLFVAEEPENEGGEAE